MCGESQCAGRAGRQQPWEKEVSSPAGGRGVRGVGVSPVERVESQAWAGRREESPSPWPSVLGRHSHQMSLLSPRTSSVSEENHGHFLLLIPTPSPACFHFLGKDIKTFISKALLPHKRIDQRLQSRYFPGPPLVSPGSPPFLFHAGLSLAPSALLPLCKGRAGRGGRRRQISWREGLWVPSPRKGFGPGLTWER